MKIRFLLIKFGEVLKFNFFEFKYLRLFVQEIYDFKKEFGNYPNKQSLESVLNIKFIEQDDPSIKQLKEFFDHYCCNIGNNNINDNYVKLNALEFCKKQTLKEAMIKSVDLLKKSSYEEIRRLIDRSFKIR